MGGDSTRENRSMLARDHLERWDHDQQASDDRNARRDRDHGE
jgi:hypothetical protein